MPSGHSLRFIQSDSSSAPVYVDTNAMVSDEIRELQNVTFQSLVRPYFR